jgi:excisionase family DNA binding protein
MHGQKWLTVKEVAHELGVGRRLVVKLTDEGHLPAMVLPSGHRRYRSSDVDRFIADRSKAVS